MNVAKALVYVECVLLVVMVVGVLGHRFQLLPFKLAFGGFAVSLALAAIAALIALVVFGLSFGVIDRAAKVPSFVAFALGIMPLVVAVSVVGAGLKLPRIHDISTHPEALVYTHAQSLRKPGENGLELASDKVLALQQAHYPQIKPIRIALEPVEAYHIALATAAALGWEVVYNNESQRVFEAVDKTALFGFVDDVVVAVSSYGNDSQVDLRSVSRVGLGDLGANAKRIERFAEAFAQNVTIEREKARVY